MNKSQVQPGAVFQRKTRKPYVDSGRNDSRDKALVDSTSRRSLSAKVIVGSETGFARLEVHLRLTTLDTRYVQ